MTELLTISEAADFLRLDPQTVKNMMNKGVLRRGEVWFKREGEIGVRFDRDALLAWVRQGGQSSHDSNVIPMARGYLLK